MKTYIKVIAAFVLISIMSFSTLIRISQVSGLQTALDAKQAKSIAAYSILSNNTNATADMAAMTYENKGIQTYSGTITFDVAQPSSPTGLQYQWIQIGKKVDVWFWFLWSGAPASNNTGVDWTWPSDLPLPIEPTGRTGVGDVLFASVAQQGTNSTQTLAAARESYIIKTGTGTYKFSCAFGSQLTKRVDAYIPYITP